MNEKEAKRRKIAIGVSIIENESLSFENQTNYDTDDAKTTDNERVRNDDENEKTTL